jgi:hypothetical protein
MFSWQWQWDCNRAVSNKFTNISKENAASILRVQERDKHGRKRYEYGGGW